MSDTRTDPNDLGGEKAASGRFDQTVLPRRVEVGFATMTPSVRDLWDALRRLIAYGGTRVSVLVRSVGA
mgnify:CR=1 FL=1|jgi:hypothetical protein